MQEKIFFENKKGLKLCGILSDPTGDVTKPMVVLCHGLNSQKNNKTNIAVEEFLSKNKISSFRFDFAGSSESEGKFEDITISQAVGDILSAIKYLKSLGYAKIGLLGTSFGGAASIMAASEMNDLLMLILKSPVSDYLEVEMLRKGEQKLKEWKEKGFVYHVSGTGEKFKLNYSFPEDFKNNDCYAVANKINVPTMIVHGSADEVAPVKQSMKLAKIIPDCKLEIVEGADHRFTNPDDFQKMLNLLSGFIIEKAK